MASWIAPQLRRPTSGFMGWIIKKILQQKNCFLEMNAVRLCQLEKHHRVLEVGFGPGLGLKAAAETIEAGCGKVHGIDFSTSMMCEAATLLDPEVIEGKVELVLGDAAYLPYRDQTMDRIYHCNCYYFWPDMSQVCKELYRVLKDDGFMVTTLNLESVEQSDGKGFLDSAVSWDPNAYIDALKETGFVNVEMKDKMCEETHQHFQVIYAYKANSGDS